MRLPLSQRTHPPTLPPSPKKQQAAPPPAPATTTTNPATPGPIASDASSPTEAFAAWATSRSAARAAARGPSWATRRAAPTTTPADARAGVAVAPPTAGFDPAGSWHTVTWAVDPAGVLDSDRIAVLWQPPGEEGDGEKDSLTQAAADTAASSDSASSASPIPAGGDAVVTGKDPIKYAFVSAASPSTWRAGRGSVRLWLPPLREAVRVAYVRAGATAATDGIWFEAGEVAGAVVTPLEPNAPSGVKLTGGVGGRGRADEAGLAAAPTAVAVSWQTRDAMDGGGVRWGVAPGPLDKWAPADCGDGGPAGSPGSADGTVFSAPDGFCTRPATKKGAPYSGAALGAISRSILTDLEPGKTYSYEVVAGRAVRGGPDDGSDGSARTVRGAFSTPPAPTNPTAPTRLLFLADGGLDLPDGWDQPDGNVWPFASVALPAVQQTPGTASYAAAQATLALLGAASVQPAAGRAAEAAAGLAAPESRAGKPLSENATSLLPRPYHGVLFTGDISYARGEAAQWDAWSASWGPALRAAPLLPAPGNHEAAGAPIFESLLESAPDDGGECGQAYARLLGAPEPDGPGKWWYASRAGPLTILHLNADQLLTPGSAQAAWLEAALKSVDRRLSPWLAVALHRPLYSDNPMKDEAHITAELRESIEKALVARGVDLVISGHLHAYQRTCHAAKGACFGDTSPSNASLPAPPPGLTPPVHILAGGGGFRSPLTAWAERPGWMAAQARAYGLGELEVTRTRLALRLHATAGEAGPDGKAAVLDELVLEKAEGWTPPDPEAAGAWCVLFFWVVFWCVFFALFFPSLTTLLSPPSTTHTLFPQVRLPPRRRGRPPTVPHRARLLQNHRRGHGRHREKRPSHRSRVRSGHARV
jgi:hypothetical protein